MVKGTKKKKNRKLGRQIRKTVGALLMVSAIIVAAIPVQDISAYPMPDTESNRQQEKIKVAVMRDQGNGLTQAETIGISTAEYSEYQSSIPYVNDARRKDDKEKIVYTSGDGKFQFVYIRPNISTPNKVAMILGYNEGVLEDSTLTIPDTMRAYRKYRENISDEGYCLVSQNDELLHYRVDEQKKDENGVPLYRVKGYVDGNSNPVTKIVNEEQCVKGTNGKWTWREKLGTDSEGNPIWSDPYEVAPDTEEKYYPCYYDSIDSWLDIPWQDLYYAEKDPTTGVDQLDKKLQPANNTINQPIVANVAYIGAEKIESNGNGGWKVKTLADHNTSASDWSDIFIIKPEDGVFAQQNNITNLSVGVNIRGISDYAFYNCSTLSSVKLNNGLETLGNGAFAGCFRLEKCEIAPNANILAIGKDAFYNCRALTSFTVPIGLQALGDCCFENCVNLQEISFGGDGKDVGLRLLGNHLFRGCSNLKGIELPANYGETNLEIDIFEGCEALGYIKTSNSKIKFVNTHVPSGSTPSSDYPNCTLTWEKFKEMLPSSFYFEAPDNSNIHDIAGEQSITFKYLGKDLYERIEYERDYRDENANPPADDDVKSAKITYQINTSGELVKFQIRNGDRPLNVTIPEYFGSYGVTSIGVGSFNDNCTLEKITIPASVTSIGNDAFKGCHNLNTVIFTDASKINTIGTGAFKTQERTCTDKLEDPPTSLTFVGAMVNSEGKDTVPFIYAMDGEHNNINNVDQVKTYITCHSGWPTNLEVQYKFDPITQSGKAQLVGYPRYELLDSGSTADIEAWVENLPYVTKDTKAEYVDKISNAVNYYKDPASADRQPTESEMALVTSTLNVVIPASVDCIQPGLFSGYTYDENGDAKQVDKDGNIVEDGSPDAITSDTYIQSILINGVPKLEPYTFKGCTAMTSADIIGSTYIDNYAFDGCTKLANVTLGTNLTDTGKRPFKGCTNLQEITCLGEDASNFVYNNGILYRKLGENNLELVETLEGRGSIIGSYTVGPEELANVSAIKEEAFYNCDEIGEVDLSSSTVATIPKGCFKEMDDLSRVRLASTVTSISDEAFQTSGLRILTIPGGKLSYIAPDAFKSVDTDEHTPAPAQKNIIFECIEGSPADIYAQATEYPYINPEYGRVFLEFEAFFYDYPNYPDTTETTLFYQTKVKEGEDAVPPEEPPVHEGYGFSGWTNHSNVTKDIDVYPMFGSNVFAVKFLDYDGTQIGETQYVEEGKSATPPEDPTREGFTFIGWSKPFYNVTEDLNITAMYSDNSGSASRHTVIFYDNDGVTEIDKQLVDHGDRARAPIPPEKEGWKFVRWIPSDLTNIVVDKTFTAYYERDDASTNVTPGPGASGSPGPGTTGTPGPGTNGTPVPTGTPGPTGRPNGTSQPTATPTATPINGDGRVRYTVTVSGGSGSGSYPAGAIVAINAYFMGEGQAFDRWTTSTAGVGFADPNAASTTFTMPAANVAITATYKPSSGSSSTGAGGSRSGNGGTTGTAATNGTVVEVTRPGISNTNLAGATVSGATDNFVVKVTEDQAATDAVVAALQARYGDISRIRYVPMDISLYDSTGRTKIADTSGISVNITLPIPDELVQYAGNNKAAAVSGGALEDLGVRFTTVGGVPCINFTATHFSPYVIYVDTANLTEGTIDTTPKTGDPIHPKWFLSLGMASIALILFFKRDKVVVQTKKA
ncbi:MAG: leucine-rich repeat protein [Lachnospiraceae bacterium]|nr:leucine-rich repeat protein [Lachnospiraceae bacterium]